MGHLYEVKFLTFSFFFFFFLFYLLLLMEWAILEAVQLNANSGSKTQIAGWVLFVFDNLEIILETYSGEGLKGKTEFCGLKECVRIWLNLRHFSSFLVFGSINCPWTLHSEITGKVLCLIICCAVWSVQQTINKQSIVVCLRDCVEASTGLGAWCFSLIFFCQFFFFFLI